MPHSGVRPTASPSLDGTDRAAVPLGADRSAKAEALVNRLYHPLKPTVLLAARHRLAAVSRTIDAGDLEEHYNAAWETLYTRACDGGEVKNPAGFLYIIVYRRALNDHRRNRRLIGDDHHLAGVATSRSDDLAGHIDDRDTLLRLLDGMAERLTPREQALAALYYLRGYTRAEAATALDVSHTRAGKLLDEITHKMAPLTKEVAGGRWCENHSSLIVAFAIGFLKTDGRRHALARAHLRHCGPCRRRVVAVRATS
jgi:DNA-directed RNA polymerase specialized sigma24 family protein